MPLNTSDRWYRAETVPISNTALGAALRNYFKVGLDAFGNKGNTSHTSGYHRSRYWVLNSPDSRYGSNDYSVRLSQDQGGDGNWISAFDFTPAEWGTAKNRQLMREITNNVLTAAKRRDDRLAILREFAGTIDGSNVITFNCSDGSTKAPFDSSHLDHVHGSAWRSLANNSFAGVFEVMTGGTKMPSEFHTGEPNGPFLTQGNQGYAGQQRDTALAFTWQAAAEANNKGSETLAKLAELKAAVGTLSVGGASIDVNALTDAIVAKLVGSTEFAALLKAQAFGGAQQAEKE